MSGDPRNLDHLAREAGSIAYALQTSAETRGPDAPGISIDLVLYEEILDRLEKLEINLALRESIAQMERGEHVPAEQAFREIRAKLGL